MNSSKTQIVRKGLSRPMRTLRDLGHVPEHSDVVLHHGEGKAFEDTRFLEGMALMTQVFEPASDNPEKNDPFVMKGARFDKSFSIFVFNTLTESERIDALHELLHCSNDVLIAVRTDKVNGKEFGDGVITKRGTFQTQLDCDDWLCFFTQWSRFGFEWPDVLHRGSGFAIIRLEREKVSQNERSE